MFIFTACNKSDEGFVKEQEYSKAEKGENILKNPNENKSVPSYDDLSISYTITYQEESCCNYKFNLNTTTEDVEVPVSVKLNGMDYDEYLVKGAETFFLSLCPDPSILVEIYVGEELCFSEALTCQCVGTGCGDVNITSNFVRTEGDCCIYSINFVPICPGGSTLLSYSVDQTIVQNLNITGNTSILVEVCNDEKKEVIVGGRDACFSEVLECVNCCNELEYTINSQHLGDGCCEFTFELLGSEECLDSYGTAFGWNPEYGQDGIDFSEFVDNTIRVRKCIPEQYVFFVVYDENQEICLITSNYQYCQD